MQFLSLGGLTEEGIKLYIIEQNNEYYIFDCGSKEPKVEDFGVSKIIPDTNFIKKNKNKIKKIFISNISNKSCGALKYLLNILDNIEVYGSDFTISYLKKIYNKKSNIFKVLYNKKKYIFGELNVTAFLIGYEIPGNYGFLIKNNENTVMLISNFSLYKDVPNYFSSDLDFLTNLKYNTAKIDYLFIGVQGIDYKKYLEENIFTKIMDKYIKETKGNIFLNLYTENLLLCYKAIRYANKNNIKIKVLGNKCLSLVKLLINKTNLKTRNKYILSNNNISKSNKKIMYLVLDDSGYPYEKMNNILKNINSEITINDNDLVLFATAKIPGKENKASDIINNSFNRKINGYEISFPEIECFNANCNDLFFLKKIINPKNIIPINAEYRNLIKFRNMLEENNFDKVKILFEGEIFNFKNNKILNKKIKIENTLINVSENEIKENKYIKEREKLAHNGLIIINCFIKLNSLKIDLSLIKIKFIGFISTNEEKTIKEKIKEIIKIEIENGNEKNLKILQLSSLIKNKIKEFILKDIQKDPIIEFKFTTI